MFWQIILGIWMSAVIVASFLYMPSTQGLGKWAGLLFTMCRRHG